MSDDDVVELQPCPFCEKLFGVGAPLIQHVAIHDDPASPPPAQRRGACFKCNQEGHWASECQNPRRGEQEVGLGRLDLQELSQQAILGAQRPAPCLKFEPPLIVLLRGCLLAQSHPVGYNGLLSGYVDHYEALAQDVNWGCGYKNIQMQLSHAVYSKRSGQHFWGPPFPGVGLEVVPDIPSLQAWIELAWQRGYDDAGAHHYNNVLQGKKAWIGTPECGALLRFLGLQAHTIDFQTRRLANGGGRNTDVFTHPAASSQEIHSGVQCDGCGKVPITGARHKSQVLADYDLCDSCHSDERRAASKGPFKRIKIQECSAEGAARLAQKLVEWVWRYFDDTSAIPKGPAQLKPDQPVKITGKPPLYFQHDGHSRTIVGIERRVKQLQGGGFDYTLLILDPATPSAALHRALESNLRWQVLVKRGMHTLKKEEYQLLYIEKLPQTQEEYVRLSNTSVGVELKELVLD